MPRKYWITHSHYLRQEGQAMPHFVPATPDSPVLVTLGDDQKPSKNMRPQDQKPAKPTKHSTKRGGDPVSPPPSGGGRAADE